MASSSSSSTTTTTIGIISIGDMGLGVAKLLMAHGYTVVTCAVGRSSATISRIESANIVNLGSDEELLSKSDVILSIVPPRDAFATAKRIADLASAQTASSSPPTRPSSSEEETPPPKIYIDLNAISPQSARRIASLFPPSSPSSLTFLDGGIIGGPPHPTSASPTLTTWTTPSILTSGPHPLPLTHPHLLTTLNITHLSATIGTASGLKCTFASLTKGLTALSIMSFTTARRLGVLGELQRHLGEYSPKTGALAEQGLKGMSPKAYRWVDEMREIGACFAADGGFAGVEGEEGKVGGGDGFLKGTEGVYAAFGEIYRFVSEGTVLGEERTESRKRGRTGEDVAECMRVGIEELESRRKKTKVEEE